MNVKTKTGLAIGAAVIAVGGVIGVGTLANAAGNATTTTGTSQMGAPGAQSQSGTQMGAPGGQQGGVPTQLVQGLATKLGIDQSTVQTAVEAAMQQVQSAGTQPQTGTSTDPREAMDAQLAPIIAQKLGVDEAKVTAAMAELRTENPMTGQMGQAPAGQAPDQTGTTTSG